MREAEFAKFQLVTMAMRGHSPITGLVGVIIAGGGTAAPLWLVREVRATWAQAVESMEARGIFGADLMVRRVTRELEARPEMMALARKLL